MTVSAVGFFCEDIREEREGAVSIIGLMPDNITIPDFIPGSMGLQKLALYVRVHFEAADNVKAISLKLFLPDGKELDLGPVEDTILKATYDAAVKTGGLCSIVLRLGLGPFPVPVLGWLKAIVTVDGREYLAGNARFTNDAPSPVIETKRQVSHRF